MYDIYCAFCLIFVISGRLGDVAGVKCTKMCNLGMCVCVCLISAESSKQYQEYQLVPNWLQTAAGWSESEGTYLWLPGSGETRVCAARAGVRPGLYKVPGPSSRQPRSSRELDRVGRCDNTCGPGHQHQVSHIIHQGYDQGDDHCLFLWPTCSRKTVA